MIAVLEYDLAVDDMAHYIAAYLYWGLRLHGIESYLQRDMAPYHAIGDSLIASYKELTVGSVRSTIHSLNMQSGESRGLSTNITVKNRNARPLHGRELAWTSSNTSVATADGKGLVIARGQGTTRIIVRSWQATDTIDVSVQGTHAPGATLAGIWEMSSPERRRTYPHICTARLTIRDSTAHVIEDLFCPDGVFDQYAEFVPPTVGTCIIDLKSPPWWDVSTIRNEYCLTPNSAFPFTLLEGLFWADGGYGGWAQETWPAPHVTPAWPVQFRKVAELPPP